ncbi:MAG: MgtC/SapB family protein [Verrucomicrobia bacterium]|nr:MgtC/SapB family protein [Verrucomicrobiota bacterium]
MTTNLPFGELLLRLGMALGAALLVGWERESHGRAAGLRTTILVCVASATAMILSENLFAATSGNNLGWKPDPARLAAGILTGMGFLGAGSIIRHENAVRGLTTAAALWFMSVIGLVFGSGYILLGCVGTGIAMITLMVLPRLESYVQNDWYGAVVVTLQIDGPSNVEIRNRIETLGMKVKKMELDYDLHSRQKTVRCEVKFKKGRLFELSEETIREMAAWPGVLQIKWN